MTLAVPQASVDRSIDKQPEGERAWRTEFVPPWWLRHAHLQTVVGNFVRRDGRLPAGEESLVQATVASRMEEEAGQTYGPTRLLSLCHWQPASVRRERLTVVLVHGLEGSASSGYVLGNASRAWAAGCNVVRMNMRSCGGSDALAPTIYHSGRSSDVGDLVRALVEREGVQRVAVVGYSMGANLVLKYAGEGAASEVSAVVGVSPLMDLALSSRALHEPANRVYERRFLRAMKRRLRAKARLFPALYGMLEEEGVYARMRSMRDFDGEIVARYGGFRDADDYYASVASSRFAATLAVPTLLLHAADDPFIRLLPETRAALMENPHVRYVETAHGGHCAFLATGGERHWAERTLLAWLLCEGAR
ncbi:MAG TPA: alpha/beta fold hydrolase [Acidobacteriaceae bacterium]